MSEYGKAPEAITSAPLELWREQLRYLYLPIRMAGGDQFDIRLPENLRFAAKLASHVVAHDNPEGFIYLSAVRGYATPGNALNRPGWHTDGFGTNDINYVWWDGPGTEFAVQEFTDISCDDVESMAQFEAQAHPSPVPRPQHVLYRLDPYVVHRVPSIPEPGCMRSFLKFSVSPDRYDLDGNSHNHLFHYSWDMTARTIARNTPSTATLT